MLTDFKVCCVVGITNTAVSETSTNLTSLEKAKLGTLFFPHFFVNIHCNYGVEKGFVLKTSPSVKNYLYSRKQ